MIVQALAEYYERLAAEPESGIAPFGYSSEPIDFCIILKTDGTLHAIQDIRVEVNTGGKSKRTQRVSRRLIVPDSGARSGTLVKPNFLWDNSGYVLGADSKGRPARSLETFVAFREFAREMHERSKEKGLGAVVAFLDRWQLADAKKLDGWDEICNSNLVFRLSNQTGYVHESPAVRAAWAEYLAEQDVSAEGFSLVSGKREPLARTHPLIRGVLGAQSSGAAIVSFNQGAFESYGKSQSFNAPVGVSEAFQYTTALNRLTSDPHRRVRLGDMTVVFWAGKPTPFEHDFLFWADARSVKAEDAETLAAQRRFLDALRRAYTARESVSGGDVPFYILGISPNAARLSIRFWLAGTVQDFAERVGRHLADLSIVGDENQEPITIDRLVMETARPKGGWPDADSVSPLLAGSVWRSVFEGTSYPQALLIQTIARVRAEGFASAERRKDWRDAVRRRAAIIKACLIRNYEMEVSVALTESGPPAYQMGRLFAVLEKTQEEAHEYNINATIKDRYFASASAAPITAFPIILRLHGHHMDKLKNVGRKVNLERMVQGIMANITDFPRQLSLPDQGMFFIGYYHQRQALFTKKSGEPADDVHESSEGASTIKQREETN